MLDASAKALACVVVQDTASYTDAATERASETALHESPYALTHLPCMRYLLTVGSEQHVQSLT